jgi:hypothetical protein
MKTYKCPKCQQTREIWEFGGKKICIHCQLEQIINSIDGEFDLPKEFSIATIGQKEQKEEK